jgi:hypothetical protein
MNKEIKTCLFCQTDNECQLDVKEDKGVVTQQISGQQCRHCGMKLPEKHPNDRKPKVKFFVKTFWLIVLFCLFMVIYLPR